ncbi:unnamed protein product [Leptosia nina]|uniref:Uncharacterized protein n=1 Tax=Leptosia nina TaxID=320188 RepID=A0AAV1JR74_9NEOP
MLCAGIHGSIQLDGAAIVQLPSSVEHTQSTVDLRHNDELCTQIVGCTRALYRGDKDYHRNDYEMRNFNEV